MENIRGPGMANFPVLTFSILIWNDKDRKHVRTRIDRRVSRAATPIPRICFQIYIFVERYRTEKTRKLCPCIHSVL